MIDAAIGIAATGVRAGRAVSGVALAPARAAYRSRLGAPARALAADVAADGAATRRLLEARAELIAQRAVDLLLEDRRTEALLVRALESPGMERLIVRVLDSRLLLEITTRALRTPEMQQLVGHIASSPELREALAEQTAGLADDMVDSVRRQTATLDDRAERTVRAWLRFIRTGPP